MIASFLGGQAISRNGLSLWVILALGTFGIVVALSIDALTPKRLYFSIDAPAIYGFLAPVKDDANAVDRALGRLHIDLRWLNEPVVARIVRRARLAGFALILEVILLGVGLA